MSELKTLFEKNFFGIIIVWFVFSFIIMWFLGGACLSFFVAPGDVGSVCLANLSWLKNIPVIGLFLPFTQWVSLFYWFSPIAGFVLSVFVMGWWNKYFDSKEAYTIFYPIVLFLFLLVGVWLTLNWYYFAHTLPVGEGVQYGLYFCFDGATQNCNSTVSAINQEYVAIYQSNPASVLNQLVLIDFWGELRTNIFLTFVLGAIFAWVPFFVKQSFFESQ